MKSFPFSTIDPSREAPTMRPSAPGAFSPDNDAERPSAVLHAALPTRLPSPSRRVLILDDEPFCARTYSLALSQAGFTVDVTDSAEQAIHMLLQSEYCVVVADLCMPGMNGLDLLRSVRVHDLDTIVLMVTAAADFSLAAEALRHGASQFLLKPVQSKALLGEVKRASGLHELAVRRRQAMQLLAVDQMEESVRSSRNDVFSRALGSIFMAFQPIFRSNGAVLGYETLLRSGDPAFKGPLELLSTADELGRSSELGRLCRSTAVRSFRQASDEALLFVNLQAHDLFDDSLLQRGNPLLAISHRVVLELTERARLGESDEIPRRVARLREAGYRIAIDDLGAGYAGLNSLVLLEPEFVKLDMSLVRGIDKSAIKQRLVGLIVETCTNLGIAIVAEGVETQEEYRMLLELKCPLFQGYLLGKPGPLKSAAAAV